MVCWSFAFERDWCLETDWAARQPVREIAHGQAGAAARPDL
jgi:hypothetical protein